MAEMAAAEGSLVDTGPELQEPPDPPQHHHHHHYLHRCQCRLNRLRWDNPDNVHLHWTVRATACIATFFKVS